MNKEINKRFFVVGNDISDGYHTFEDLYEHRYALFIALVNQTSFPVFVKHNHYEGYSAVYLVTTNGQVSYHLPTSLLGRIKREWLSTPKDFYDGHSGLDVKERLINL